MCKDCCEKDQFEQWCRTGISPTDCDIMVTHGYSCSDWGLPTPPYIPNGSSSSTTCSSNCSSNQQQSLCQGVGFEDLTGFSSDGIAKYNCSFRIYPTNFSGSRGNLSLIDAVGFKSGIVIKFEFSRDDLKIFNNTLPLYVNFYINETEDEMDGIQNTANNMILKKTQNYFDPETKTLKETYYSGSANAYISGIFRNLKTNQDQSAYDAMVHSVAKYVDLNQNSSSSPYDPDGSGSNYHWQTAANIVMPRFMGILVNETRYDLNSAIIDDTTSGRSFLKYDAFITSANLETNGNYVLKVGYISPDVAGIYQIFADISDGKGKHVVRAVKAIVRMPLEEVPLTEEDEDDSLPPLYKIAGYRGSVLKWDYQTADRADLMHSANNYLTSEIKTRFLNLVREYREKLKDGDVGFFVVYPVIYGLVITDMSLPWGGIYSVGTSRSNDNPTKFLRISGTGMFYETEYKEGSWSIYGGGAHTSHRYGINIDVSFTGIRSSTQTVLTSGNNFLINFNEAMPVYDYNKTFKQILSDQNINYQIDTENHYHLSKQ